MAEPKILSPDEINKIEQSFKKSQREFEKGLAELDIPISVDMVRFYNTAYFSIQSLILTLKTNLPQYFQEKYDWWKHGTCPICKSILYKQSGDFFGFPPQICSHERIDVQAQKFLVSGDEWREFLSKSNVQP
jgi:hypothetical protein